jgi:pyruvate,water dikinase
VPDGFVILPAAFEGDDLKPAAWEGVERRLAQLRRGDEEMAFAVRSSALSEDSAFASFAGEFETVLDVHSDEMVREAIHTVRRSRHSERVRAYSEAKGLDAQHDMAVVVQRLIRADVSGILFTADPVSGNRARMTGNYVFGFGEELVSGEAEPFTFTLERPKGRYEGPSEMRRFARRMYRLASRLEKELGNPQDIEWCVADGRLYLLQSRPITTLMDHDPVTQDWNSSHTGDYLWGDAGGIYPEVMTPSTWSVHNSIFGQRLAGAPFMGNIGGRFYVNFSMMQSMLAKFGQDPSGSMWSLIVGEVPEGVEVPLVPLTLREILSSASPRMLIRQRRMKAQGEEFLTELRERCRKLCLRIQSSDAEELAALWEEEMSPLFWDAYLVQDASNEDYIIPYTSLKRKLTDLLGEEKTAELISTIGGDAAHLASAGIGLGLFQVARGDMTREEYMARYGHRHANENELSQPLPHEDPEWLDRQLAELAENPVDVEGKIGRRAARFDAAWAEFAESYPKQASKLKRRVDKVVAATQMREAIRSEFTRTIGVIRVWFLRAGELTDLGEDIWFLTYDEVVDLLVGDDVAVANIPARRTVYEQYKSLPAYPVWIRGRFDPHEWAVDPDRRHDLYDADAPMPVVSDARVIEGHAGSAGRVEGRVRLVESPD